MKVTVKGEVGKPPVVYFDGKRKGSVRGVDVKLDYRENMDVKAQVVIYFENGVVANAAVDEVSVVYGPEKK